MSVVERYSDVSPSSIDVWENIIDKIKPKYITGAVYFPLSGHGITPKNEYLVLEASGWREKVENLTKNGEVFAIGPLMYKGLYLLDNKNELTQDDISKLWEMISSHITHQPFLPGIDSRNEIRSENNLSRYYQSYFCLVDFDCKVDPNNQNQIINVLMNNNLSDWYLFDSGGGYHLVFEDCINGVSLLIQKYGALINMFARETSGKRSHIFESFGNDFIKYSELLDIYNGDVMMKDPQKIIDTCNDIFRCVGHMDETSSEKLKFIIDLRFLAHVITDLLRTDTEDIDGFGVLRIIAGKYQFPPFLVAARKNKNVFIYNNKVDRLGVQMELPGFNNINYNR